MECEAEGALSAGQTRARRKTSRPVRRAKILFMNVWV